MKKTADKTQIEARKSEAINPRIPSQSLTSSGETIRQNPAEKGMICQLLVIIPFGLVHLVVPAITHCALNYIKSRWGIGPCFPFGSLNDLAAWR